RGSRGWLWRSGAGATLLGCLACTAGLGIRLAISPWGAVTNLYETLVYVALITGVLGLVLAWTGRRPAYVVAAAIGAALCAMVGEAMPADLGAHIGQLQPVLRSKFWLWVHVKVIVASYAAFVLAWVLGNWALARAALHRRPVEPAESQAIYRCLQVGVVLIAAGTLLGGVWADQAWGRFWGWDPKEVWALVILLVYLVPLHLRYIGMVGPNGMAAWAVHGFQSVVMSWYGVNFILGAGLHAYATGSGFGSGGQLIVLPLIAVQTALAVWWHRRAVAVAKA
ncbi:MAG: cytochrome c biogenesis protein CcsA, partial [Planctomycetes bacterium]|nr:cytochrome c biogenesis protein CcsA [Planctomycetota bacterium]